MRRFLPLFAVLSLAFAPAPFPKPQKPQDGIKAIQGTWKIISRTFEGGKPDHVVSTLEVTDRSWTYIKADGSWRAVWDYSVIRQGAHWRFDAKAKGGPLGRPRSTTLLARGILQVKGDKLIMCYTLGDSAKRPGDFDGGKPKRTLDVFTRIKQ